MIIFPDTYNELDYQCGAANINAKIFRGRRNESKIKSLTQTTQLLTP